MSDVRPNILWISLEDTSPRFGCYGDPVAQTPNIDALAADGCRYPNAFCTSGVSAPSRSAIITGMYQTSIGTHHMRTAHTNRYNPGPPTPYEACPPPYVKCFPEYLRAAGYYCTNNHKTDYQFSAPFTAWDELGPDAHWRNRPKGTPFFSVFNPTLTHESGMWPNNRPRVTNADDVKLPPYLADTPKSREALAKQYDNIATSDGLVGDWLKQLDEDGLSENTIVFLWSDHGEGLPRAKRWPYDAGIRIPLIVRWPKNLDRGSVSDQLVSLVDLGPTVLSLTGTPVPAHMQGQPFLGPQKRERACVFATRDRHDESYDMVRAVRDKRFKYIRHYYPGTPYLSWIPYSFRHPAMQELWRLHREGNLQGAQHTLFGNRPPEELYDTQEDPHELKNLAGDPAHAETLERLRGELDAWRTRHGDLGDEPESEMVRRWWPDGVQPQTMTPLLLPLSDENMAAEPLMQTVRYAAPLWVQIHCATQGASVAWRLDDEQAWKLYRQPLRIEQSATLHTKAVRIGYKESAATTTNITIE